MALEELGGAEEGEVVGVSFVRRRCLFSCTRSKCFFAGGVGWLSSSQVFNSL